MEFKVGDKVKIIKEELYDRLNLGRYNYWEYVFTVEDVVKWDENSTLTLNTYRVLKDKSVLSSFNPHELIPATEMTNE
jgi:hypothetical protein